jgi:uncharacterized membrane protein
MTIRKLWPGLTGVLLAALFGFLNMARLPTRVAIHWGFHGEVNGWSSRNAFLWLMPGIAVVVAVILAVAPRVDPRYRNFPKHADSYWLVANVVLLFLAATHVVMIGYNLGWPVDLPRLLGGGAGLLFIVMGNVLTRIRPNWIFGIRTPWSLTSEAAWRASHRVGGYLFVIAGIATLLAAVLVPSLVVAALLVGLGIATLAAVITSYVVWKNDPAAHNA